MARAILGPLLLCSSLLFAQPSNRDATVLFGFKGPVRAVHTEIAWEGSDQLRPESNMVFTPGGQIQEWERYGRDGEIRLRRIVHYNVEVPLQEEETTYWRNPKRVVKTFDRTGNISQREVFNLDGKLRERQVYQFTADQIRVKHYDAAGKMIRESVVDVIESGDDTHHKIERYSQGKLLARSTYDNSSGSLKTKTESFDSSGKKREIREEGASGNLVATVSPDGSASAQLERPDGQPTETIDTFTGSRQTSKYNDLGQLVEERSVDSDGKIGQVRSFEYANDSNGNWVRSTEKVAVEGKVIKTVISTRTITYY